MCECVYWLYWHSVSVSLWSRRGWLRGETGAAVGDWMRSGKSWAKFRLGSDDGRRRRGVDAVREVLGVCLWRVRLHQWQQRPKVI